MDLPFASIIHFQKCNGILLITCFKQGDFAPEETFNNFWRHVWLSRLARDGGMLLASRGRG